MKQFAGYGLIVIAFISGHMVLHPGLIPALALAATFVFASLRKALDQGSAHQLKRNPFVEGVFLFFLQCMIMFVVYYLGYFLAEAVRALILQ